MKKPICLFFALALLCSPASALSSPPSLFAPSGSTAALRLDEPVTQAEFLTMLLRAQGRPEPARWPEDVFSQTDQLGWTDASQCHTAAQLTLSQAAPFLCRAFSLSPETDSIRRYPDVLLTDNSVFPEDLPYLLALYRGGIIEGSPDLSIPLTRGQAQALILRAVAEPAPRVLPLFSQEFLSFSGISLVGQYPYRLAAQALPEAITARLSGKRILVACSDDYERYMRSFEQAESSISISCGFTLGDCAAVRQRLRPDISTFYHEIFHLVDPETAGEQTAFSENAQRQALDHRACADPREHMARCFVLYLSCPEKLRAACPLSFGYLDRLCGNS